MRKGREPQQHKTSTKEGQPGLGRPKLSSNVLTGNKDFSGLLNVDKSTFKNRCRNNLISSAFWF